MPPEDRDGTVWRVLLVGIATVVGASVLWGWLRPERDDAVATVLVPASVGEGDGDVSLPSAPTVRSEPRWLRPTIRWTLAMVLVVVIGFVVLRSLRDVVGFVLLSLFFSFALDPAVGYMQRRRGWRRGSTTALLLTVVFVLLVAVALVFVPAMLRGLSTVVERIGSSLADAGARAADAGVTVETASISETADHAAASLTTSAAAPWSVLGITGSLVSAVVGFFTVAMFTFYMVAEGPRFRRAVLSMFSEPRQEELLAVWEAAIEKTGGYFYSRLLLATINGGLCYVVLRLAEVPGAAALALFEGVVAAFIPIVGTYIAGTVPVVAALLTVGRGAALAVLAYILVYQQVENYVLSPRIQGRTMRLHPAVAFGAALVGGALGGLLWAFLALPFAATVQASASLWIEQHDVVDTELTRVEPVVVSVGSSAAPEHHPVRDVFRRTRGWIRRSV